MQYIILLAIISAVYALPSPDNCDRLVTINGLQFEEEVLKDGLSAPFQLSIEHSTNSLFFAVAAVFGKNTGTIGFLNITSGEVTMFKQFIAGTATSVDNVNHKAYLGSTEGIHMYDIVTKEIKLIDPLPSIMVWQLFFKDRLYYTDLIKNVVYVYENGKSNDMKDLNLPNVGALVVGVDKKDNIWVSTGEGLSVYDRNERRLIHKGDYVVNSFTTDVEGNLFFLTINGFYKIEEDRSINMVWDKQFLYGVAIDSNNNMIYADEHRIIRLNPVSTEKFTCK